MLRIPTNRQISVSYILLEAATPSNAFQDLSEQQVLKQFEEEDKRSGSRKANSGSAADFLRKAVDLESSQ
jgi:hypothetical protein